MKLKSYTMKTPVLLTMDLVEQHLYQMRIP